jgi:hypothetical protein
MNIDIYALQNIYTEHHIAYLDLREKNMTHNSGHGAHYIVVAN